MARRNKIFLCIFPLAYLLKKLLENTCFPLDLDKFFVLIAMIYATWGCLYKGKLRYPGHISFKILVLFTVIYIYSSILNYSGALALFFKSLPVCLWPLFAVLFGYYYCRSFRDILFFIHVLNVLLIIILIIMLTTVILTKSIYFFRKDIYYNDLAKKIFGLTVFYNPNVLMRTILIIWPFCLYNIRLAPKKSLKIISIVNTIFAPLGIILTFSRMGVILLIFTFFIFLFRKTCPTSIKIIFIFCFILLISLFTPFIFQRFTNLIIEWQKYHIITLRPLIYKASLDIFLQHPILGIGANQSTAALSQVSYLINMVQTIKGKDIIAQHNNFLLILMESGIVGFLLFFIFFISLFMLMNQVKSHNLYISSLIDCCKLSIILFFLSGLTAVNLGELLGWIVIGLVYSIRGRNDKDNFIFD